MKDVYSPPPPLILPSPVRSMPIAVKIIPIRTANDSNGEFVDHSSEPFVMAVFAPEFHVEVAGIVTDVSTL